MRRARIVAPQPRYAAHVERQRGITFGDWTRQL